MSDPAFLDVYGGSVAWYIAGSWRLQQGESQLRDGHCVPSGNLGESSLHVLDWIRLDKDL